LELTILLKRSPHVDLEFAELDNPARTGPFCEWKIHKFAGKVDCISRWFIVECEHEMLRFSLVFIGDTIKPKMLHLE
jgi:hypothetical protein